MSERTVFGVDGGTGIGNAAAERLMRRGVHVGRCEAVLVGAKGELGALNPDAFRIALAGDAGDEAAPHAASDRPSTSSTGRTAASTVLALTRPCTFSDTDAVAWRRMLSAMLDVVMHVAVAAAREMVNPGESRFVLISSINAPLSESEAAHYSAAAKAGVRSLARSHAVDLAKQNIVCQRRRPRMAMAPLI